MSAKKKHECAQNTVSISTSDNVLTTTSGPGGSSASSPSDQGTEPLSMDLSGLRARRNELKEEANKCFRNNDWKGAEAKYSDAIGLLTVSCTAVGEDRTLQAVLWSNRAMCFIKLREFLPAISDCKLAIQADGGYVKAYFRKAFAHEGLAGGTDLQELQAALMNYTQVLKFEPSNADAQCAVRRLKTVLERASVTQVGSANSEVSVVSLSGHKSDPVDSKTAPELAVVRRERRLSELSDRSLEFLQNVSGFLQSKRAVDATAEAVLPHKWMEQHPSFADKTKPVQKNVRGEIVKNIDELLEVASRAKPKFDELMRKIVADSKMNPDEEVRVEGKPLMLDHHTAFKVLSLAPLKGTARIAEKVENEYKGDFSQVFDVVRCSIVVFTEEQLESVAQFLAQVSKKQEVVSVQVVIKGDTNTHYVVARLKNRFKTPLFNGYRDALYSIVVDCGEGVTHVCEVQLHLAAVVAHKENSHKYYEYFRSYFAGSGAEEKRMEALEKVYGSSGDVDKMMHTVLHGSDVTQLEALHYLVSELMGDVKLPVLIRKRILELNDSFANKSTYGTALQRVGMHAQAEALLREALAGCKQQLGASHPSTLGSINNLANLLQARGKLQEAEPLFREALAGYKEQLGPSHPHTRACINNLANLLQARGKLQEAEPLFREDLAGCKQQLGPSHPDTLSCTNNLATLLQNQGKLQEAEPLFREALVGRRKQLGASHPGTLSSSNNLANLLQDQGKLEEAEALFREALAGSKEQLGTSHTSTLACVNNLAALLQDQGKLQEAEPLFREALAGRRKQLGASHPDTLIAVNNLANCLHTRGKLEEAEPLLKGALAGSKAQLGASHPNTLNFVNNLAGVLQDQGKLQEAEALFREALAGCKQQLGASHPDTLGLINNLASLLLYHQGNPKEAVPLFREALAGYKKELGISHPSTQFCIKNFVQAQRKLKEASH